MTLQHRHNSGPGTINDSVSRDKPSIIGPPSRASRPDPATSPPNALHQEAIDYCLRCANYVPDPEKPELCIEWETCHERQKLFPFES